MKRRRRTVVLVAALLGAAGVAICLRQPVPAPHQAPIAADPADAATRGIARSTTGSTATATDAPSTSGPHTPIAATAIPEEFARAWQARALKTIRHKNARLLGEKVADLLALPPDQAWLELTRRAHAGDGNAAAAALHLAEECRSLRQAGGPTQAMGPPSSLYEKDLSSDQVQRLRAVQAILSEQVNDRAARCAAVSGAAEFVVFASEHFMRSDDPAAQRDAIQGVKNDTEAIAMLRELMRSDASAETRLALGERLLRSNDLAQQREGRALLEPLASTGDAEAITLFVLCQRRACDAFRDDRMRVQAWQERAARLGDWFAIQMQIDDFASDQAMASAWAWAQYRALLAQEGCYEFPEPGTNRLGAAQSDAMHRQVRLSPNQRVAGDALLRQLLAQWSAAAHAAQGCG